MRTLSERNSTGNALLAPMPPTLAAASTTSVGLVFFKKAVVASRSSRSTTVRLTAMTSAPVA